jgi:hypothetical protein
MPSPCAAVKSTQGSLFENFTTVEQIVGPEPREATFASSMIWLSCSVTPWPGQLNRYPTMLNIDEIPWAELTGGYRAPYDPRPVLNKLEANLSDAWHELWEELYHQGDVGEASYATVPFLVDGYQQLAPPKWNVFALVATIDLARDNPSNPSVPDWLLATYQESIYDLAQIGLIELRQPNDPDFVRGILSIVALWKGARTYARMLVEFSEAEIREFEEQALGKSVVG